MTTEERMAPASNIGNVGDVTVVLSTPASITLTAWIRMAMLATKAPPIRLKLIALRAVEMPSSPLEAKSGLSTGRSATSTSFALIASANNR
jgi:hypothetical protein